MNQLFLSNIKRKLIKLGMRSIRLGNVIFDYGHTSDSPWFHQLSFSPPIEEWDRPAVILDAQKLFSDEAIVEVRS